MSLDLATRLRVMVAYCRDRDGVMDEPKDSNIPGLMESAAIQIEDLRHSLDCILHRHLEDEFIPTEYWDMAKEAVAKAKGEA